MSYWDIGHFLAEEEKLQFSFLEDAYDMEFVDPSKEFDGYITAGESLNTPIWIINTIYDYLGGSDNVAMIKVKIPDYLNSKSFDNQVKAFDSDLNSKVQKINIDMYSPYFYEMYLAIRKTAQNELGKEEGEKIAKLLEKRGLTIMTKGITFAWDEKIQGSMKKYCKFEFKVYQKTKAMTKQYDKWRYHKLWEETV